MTEDASLKDEMNELLRADRERAQERRAAPAAPPAKEPAPAVPGRLRRLLGRQR